jgi:hypothetical protein
MSGDDGEDSGVELAVWGLELEVGGKTVARLAHSLSLPLVKSSARAKVSDSPLPHGVAALHTSTFFRRGN